MANAVVGRVLLIPKGNYSASVSYSMLDIVRYENKSWVCKQACTGQAPQAGDYWQMLVQDGTYCYIRYSANADGTDFVAVPTEQTKYVGFYTGDSETAPTEKTSYAWSKYVGEDGTIGVDGVRGTRINQGTAITGVSTTPIPFPTGITDSLIGDEYQNTTTWNVYRCTTGGDAATALWIYVGNIKGADGLGSGDMLKSVYDTDNSGVVDMAEKLQTARTIALTGDVTGTASFDGSANVSIAATVTDDSHNHVISNVDGLQDALNAKQPLTNGLTAETGLADADTVPFYDASNTANRKSTWANIKAVLKTYFDTLYGRTTISDSDGDDITSTQLYETLSSIKTAGDANQLDGQTCGAKAAYEINSNLVPTKISQSDFINSIATGWSIATFSAYKVGRIVFINLFFRSSSTSVAIGTTVLATVKDDYKPMENSSSKGSGIGATQAFGEQNKTCVGAISSVGNLSITTETALQDISVSVIYLS